MTRLPPLLVSLAVLVGALVWSAVPVRAADPAPVEKPSPPPSLLGLTREEVIDVRGKPSGERDRGEVRLMVYPDGTKLELREGRVVAVSGGSGAEIVGADGTRYVPGADGNIQRPVQIIEPEDVQAPPTRTEPVSSAEVAAPKAASPPSGGVADAHDPDLPPGGTAPPSIEAAKDAAAARAAAVDEAGAEDEPSDEFDEDEELSPVFKIVAFVIGSVLRFGLTVLVLRLALHFVGVPFFWPDLLKVALLYLAVHEVLSGLGGMGGLWEFVPLFRLDEIVSFIVLACSLTWFKIAGSGITALKIAVATKIAVLVLMLGVGLVVALALTALQ